MWERNGRRSGIGGRVALPLVVVANDLQHGNDDRNGQRARRAIDRPGDRRHDQGDRDGQQNYDHDHATAVSNTVADTSSSNHWSGWWTWTGPVCAGEVRVGRLRGWTRPTVDALISGWCSAW